MKKTRKEKIKIKWSPNFAYALGLLTTDGNLSKDTRHFDFTSKDLEQVVNLKRCLNLKNRISQKTSGTKKKSYRIQFGDVRYYKFLLRIGLSTNKSKSIGGLEIQKRYFWDFLRGHFDGDGTFYSYFDKRWKSSFMFYMVFVSASKNHIIWLQKEICDLIKIKGHLTSNSYESIFQLKYAKSESLKLLKHLYYDRGVVCLSRKRLKIEKALAITGKKL